MARHGSCADIVEKIVVSGSAETGSLDACPFSVPEAEGGSPPLLLRLFSSPHRHHRCSCVSGAYNECLRHWSYEVGASARSVAVALLRASILPSTACQDPRPPSCSGSVGWN
ncbi:Piso0_003618 [Millerozyma farinosa CBS 7064]|uniref:Piso0_003618 protein n=1 Tax=Pichia sorbitophila (strain ATCC MYA-4447 / BCRC 22081 / CBS 7064 / NBRC 10061 / NRRL Y-12695) TaxID=559304 RepID=G8YGE9_PICSO|nr:Piso0_003618 [Millerozyma farinosa CBS 7064]CCE81266.1 Piso0_003618 [Millerozyma farinosa CBS 7064]